MKISHSDSREHIGEHVSVHKGNLARDGGKPKGGPVMVHPGMTKKQSDAAGIGGMGHATATIAGGVTIPTSAAAAPLQHAYGSIPKVREAAPFKPGMRSRVNGDGLGTAIMDDILLRRGGK